MLVDLLKHLHVSLDVCLQLCHFPLLGQNDLGALSLILQALGEGLDLRILVLDQIDLLVYVHAESIQLVDVLLAFFQQIAHLHVFVALIADQVLQLCLLLLIFSEHIEVLHLHGLVVVGDVLHVVLSFLVLAQFAHKNLVVILKFAYLVAILGSLVCTLKLLLELVDFLVALL